MKVIVALVLPLLAVPMSASRSPGAKPVFSAALFAPLVTGKESQKRWVWPETAAFHSTWTEGERAARPVRLVRGAIGAVADVVVALTPLSATEYGVSVVFAPGVEPYEARNVVPHAERWTVQGELAAGKVTLVSGAKTVTIDAAYVSPLLAPTAEPFADWIYVSTLLASETPIYIEPGERTHSKAHDTDWKALESEMKAADTKAALARIEKLLEAKVSGYDYRWDGAASFAAKHDKALARRVFAIYRPVGQCSMDTRPAGVAREYAELCYQMGDLGCYLQLSVQIMGNQFDRVAWGSYAEPVHHTQSEKLAESGLDVDRFLLGLATTYGTEKARERELGTWRLARSIVESGRVDTVKPQLEKRAEDGTLDEMNRLRAVIVLAWLESAGQFGRPTEEERKTLLADRAARLAALAKLDLSPVSRLWVEDQQRELR